MNKFTRFGAIVALLFASVSANAFPVLGPDDTEVAVGASQNDSTLQFWAWDDRIPDYDIAAVLVSRPGADPKFIFNYPNEVYMGSNSIQSMFDSKANQSDLTTLTSTVSGLGTPFSGSYTDLTNKPTLFSGSYTDLTSKPSLFSGAYVDLTGKPSLATVATSGAYSDLSGKPTLATVATTGAYADLMGKPSIPAAQVNADWNASSGVAQVLNKPTIPTNTNQLTNGSSFITASGAPVQSVNGQTGTVTLSIPTVPVSYEGVTTRPAFYVYKTATVSSGVAVYQLTADNTSTGTALCSNPIAASVNPTVNDATASYQYGWAFSNSNKTLTVTTNKLTTSNILTGILGQTAANGSVVNLSVACY